jgi:hypothetical protein
MEIIYRDNNRILVKDSKEEININDNNIISYTGVYYKTINEITRIAEVKTTFIGIIECERYRFDKGIIGVYVKPLYIWDNIYGEWKKIINYENPKKKYFYYPHLLSLHKNDDYKELNYFHTCKNENLNDYENIEKTFDLQIPQY